MFLNLSRAAAFFVSDGKAMLPCTSMCLSRVVCKGSPVQERKHNSVAFQIHQFIVHQGLLLFSIWINHLNKDENFVRLGNKNIIHSDRSFG